MIFCLKKENLPTYKKKFKNSNIKIINEIFDNNFNYMPIIFKSKKIKDLVFKKLKNKKIFARKYFYPH